VIRVFPKPESRIPIHGLALGPSKVWSGINQARQLENIHFRLFRSAPRTKALGVQSIGDPGKRAFFSNQLQKQGQDRRLCGILFEVQAIVRYPKTIGEYRS